MSIFSTSCFEHFDSSSVEKEETTLGIIWKLKAGWNTFDLVSPLRPFLQLQFVINSPCRQKITLGMRDHNNDQFFVVNHFTDGISLAKIRTPCPASWGQVLEIFCPAACQLMDIIGADFIKDYDTYTMNSRADLDIQALEVTPKFSAKGVEFDSEFKEPWEALIRSKHAFSGETIYVEHFYALAPTQVFTGSAEETLIKGEVSLAKGGSKTGLQETRIKSSGGRVEYKTQALMRGSPALKIKRITESGSQNGTYYI